jgi:hypothetical protein
VCSLSSCLRECISFADLGTPVYSSIDFIASIESVSPSHRRIRSDFAFACQRRGTLLFYVATARGGRGSAHIWRLLQAFDVPTLRKFEHCQDRRGTFAQLITSASSQDETKDGRSFHALIK